MAQIANIPNEDETLPIDEATPEAQEYLEIGPENSKPTVSTGTAEQRAKKAHIGMGPDSPGEDAILSEIMQGREDALRARAARLEDIKKQQGLRERLNAVQSKRVGPITSDEVDFILTAANPEPTDPFSVFEETYAREMIKHVTSLTSSKGNFVTEAAVQEPQLVEDTANKATEFVKYVEYLKTKKEDLEALIKNQSTAGFVFDLFKTAVPYYTWASTQNAAIEAEGFFQGTNMEGQRRALFRLPFNEFKQRIDQGVESINTGVLGGNPSVALYFIESLLGRAGSDILLDDVLGAVDIATTVGGVAGRALRIRNFYKDVAKTALDPETKPEKVLAAAGDVKEAAAEAVKTIVKDDLNPGAVESQSKIRFLFDVLPSLYKRGTITENPGSLSREAAIRLEEAAVQRGATLIKALTSIGRVERLTDEAILAAVKDLQETLVDRFPSLNGTLLDIGTVLRKAEDTPENVHWVEYRFGTKDGFLFETEEEARVASQAYGLGKYEHYIKNTDGSLQTDHIKQQGAGFYISIQRPLPETANVTRDGLLTTDNVTPKGGWLADWLGFLRTPEDTLPSFQNKNRTIVTTAPQELKRLIYEAAQEIGEVRKGGTLDNTGRRISARFGFNKKRFEQLKRILQHNQNMTSPVDGKRGYYYRTVGELEEAYQQNFGRVPEEQEVRAYFAAVQIGEMDYVIRNLDEFRNKARHGTEQVRITLDNETMSDWFDGIRKKDLPFGQDVNVYIPNLKTGKGMIRNIQHLHPTIKSKLEKDIKEGKYEVVQLYSPSSKPFRDREDVGGVKVHFVLGQGAEYKGLDYNQLPYRPGGHIEYEFDWWIKQPRVRKERIGKDFHYVYEGETTVMPFVTRAQAEKYLPLLNEAIRLYRIDKNLAKTYVQSKLPIEWKEFNSWFHKRKNAEGKTEGPFLNIDEDLVLLPHGTGTLDINKEFGKKYGDAVFKDASNDPWDLSRQSNTSFTQERDDPIWTITEKGSSKNPLVRWEQAEVVDPIDTMNRSFGRIIHSHYFDDYKFSAIESWVREAMPYLRAQDFAIETNPFYYFYHGTFKEDISKVDNEKLNALKLSNFQIQQLMGVKSSTATRVNSMKQKLMDSIYNRGGQRAVDVVDTWVLPRIKDPVQAGRSFAFHLKLGLFAVPQLMVQMQTWTHVLAVAGARNGLPGFAAAGMSRWLAMNSTDEVLQGMAKKMAHFGWKPEDFVLSHKELQKTGFWNVMGETATLDDLTDYNIIRGGKEQFLNTGAVFFREGERMARLAGWHAAFKEWRRANPHKTITNADRNTILQRANLLTVNMIRSSNSAVQNGIFSVPLQFLTYQLRLMEQMLGKRLTAGERARVLMTYSAMYGVPAALSTTGIPFYENFRQAALASGAELDQQDGIDGFVNKLFFEGVPSTILTLITNNDYNVTQRYSPQGFTQINEILYEDKSWWDVVIGAAGSVFGETLLSGKPFLKALVSFFTDEPDQRYELTPEDYAGVLKNISSVNSLYRTAEAINTGRFVSRKGTHIDNVGKGEAIFMGILGLSPQATTDAWFQNLEQNHFNQLKRKVAKEIKEDVQAALRAAENNDEASMTKYMKRIKIAIEKAGLDPSDASDIYSRAFSGGNATLVEQFGYRFSTEGPVETRDARQEEFIENQERRMQREGN